MPFVHTRFCSRCSYRHIQIPHLPAYFFLSLSCETAKPDSRTPTPLFIEFHCNSAAHAATPATIGGTSYGRVLANKGAYAGVDEGFKVYIVDGGEGEI